MPIKAYAASEAKAPFEPFEFEPVELKHDEVEITVDYCGICHSDLSMLDNEWGMTTYPFVGGHEAVGKVSAVGVHVPNLKVGDRAGLGWISRSCTHCFQCVGGNQNRCATQEATVVARHGAFADRVRCHWTWAIQLPDAIDMASAGPLFCGGLTVFNAMVQNHLKPTSRVGIIGIGGLGHMAIMFADKWGCEVAAFSTRKDKEEETRGLGADEFVSDKEPWNNPKLQGKFDLIINTTNAGLNWDGYVAMLAPGGVLHTVGVVSNPFGVTQVFPLIAGQKSLSGTPLGSPATSREMIDFCARHQIRPMVEEYPLSKINDAFDKLRNGSPRYRLVLKMGA